MILLFLFLIWSETYFVINKERLDISIKEKEVSNKLDILYYISIVVFYIWLVLGFFTNLYSINIIILLLILFEYILSKANLLSYILYRNISPILKILLYVYSIMIIISYLINK
jgi:hypothetical protein